MGKYIRYVTITGNWLVTLVLILVGVEYFDSWWPYVKDNQELAYGAAGALLSSLVFAIRRRVTTKRPLTDFFNYPELMVLPDNKIRYSDRMAYVMAEMSELAYYEVERGNDNFVQFAELAKTSLPESEQAISGLIDLYKKQTRSGDSGGAGVYSEKDLQELLDKNGFVFQAPYLNKGSAQGFICYKKEPNPYIVVAFRGSEKKIEDWLTNADATPMPESEVKTGKVHSGFYRDFKGLKQTIEASLQKIRDTLGDPTIPVFFTGHSLGGAVATIATRELMPDGNGACYTYGAPRVGDYSYFEFVKTPVYRVVNSSDIVPRVPPGAWTVLFIKAMTLAKFLTVKIEWANSLVTAAEGWLNRLKDYRHFGDLRYLTDIKAGDLNKVMLLRNPSSFDVLQWFWRHIMVSYGMPVKSHSLTIYREKLAEIGMKRINKEAIPRAFGDFVS